MLHPQPGRFASAVIFEPPLPGRIDRLIEYAEHFVVSIYPLLPRPGRGPRIAGWLLEHVRTYFEVHGVDEADRRALETMGILHVEGRRPAEASFVLEAGLLLNGAAELPTVKEVLRAYAELEQFWHAA